MRTLSTFLARIGRAIGRVYRKAYPPIVSRETADPLTWSEHRVEGEFLAVMYASYTVLDIAGIIRVFEEWEGGGA